jgi:Fic family protein
MNHRMEPLIPDLAYLRPRAEHLWELADDLGRHLHPLTLEVMAGTLRTVNCYYSNLIEGHDTHPIDIDRALHKDYSRDPKRRDLQKEAWAHIEVQKLIEARLTEEPRLNVCAPEFLRWIHKEFYDRLPEDFRWVTGPSGMREPVHPGEYRHHDVKVGVHIPLAPAELPGAMARFAEVYDPAGRPPVESLAMLGAAHHRLLWIHPFGDGNGRVTRLMTDAMLRRIGVKSHGLWTASRGLARARDRYRELLAGADAAKWDDYDGRGELTLKGLTGFSEFFLGVCADQVTYMSGVLEVDGLAARMERYAIARSTGLIPPPPERPEAEGKLRPELAPLLRDLIYRGEIPRAEVPGRLGVLPRTARRIVEGGVAEGVLVAKTRKAPLRLAVPSTVAGYLLPGVYGN